MTISVQKCKMMPFSDIPYSEISLFNKRNVCVCVWERERAREREREREREITLYLQTSAESDNWRGTEIIQSVVYHVQCTFHTSPKRRFSNCFTEFFLSTYKLLNFTWILFLPLWNMSRFLGVRFVFGCLGALSSWVKWSGCEADHSSPLVLSIWLSGSVPSFFHTP